MVLLQRGATPLHKAMKKCRYSSIETLITKQNITCFLSQFGLTPLHEAAWNNREDEIIGLLIKNGAKTDIEDMVHT